MRVTGTATAEPGSRVQVQSRTPRGWRTLTASRLRPGHAYAARVTPRSTGRWVLRVVAGRAHSAPVRVDVVKSWIVTATPRSAYLLAGGSTRVDVSVEPRAAGAAVVLQRRGAHGWSSVATRHLDHRSATSFPVRLTAAGVARYRVVKRGGHGLRPGTSAVQQIEAGRVALSPGTQVVTAEEADQLRSYRPATGQLVVGPGPLAARLQPGDIVSSAVTAATPEGMLRRVTSATYLPSGATVLETRQATVAEAVGATDGPLHIKGTVVARSLPAGAHVRSRASRRAPLVLSQRFHTELTEQGSTTPLQYPGGKLEVSGPGTLVVDAGVAISTDAELDWDQGWTGINKVRMVLHNRLDSDASFTDTGSLAVAADFDFARWPGVISFAIGPLVVIIINTTSVPFTLEGKASGDLPTISQSSSAHSDIGFEYTPDTGVRAIDDRGFEPAADLGAEWDLLPTFEVDLSVGLRQQEDLYGVTGLEGKAAAYGKFEYQPPSTCAASLGLRLEMGLEAGLSMLGLQSRLVLTNDVPAKEWHPCGSDVPVIRTQSLPPAIVDQPYDEQLELEKDAPGAWSVQSGTLPPGLDLNLAGTIAGTPTQTGSYPVTIAFTDEAGHTVTRDLVLTVTDLRLDTTDLGTLTTGAAVSTALAASGGTEPYAFTVTGQPDGLSVAADGTITGTPTTAGSGTMTVTVTDADGAARTGPVTWVVKDPPPPVDPADGGTVTVGTTPPPSCPGSCGTSWGDPHLVTFDGVAYDAQRVGELTLVRSTTDDLEVQERQQPWNGSSSVAVNTAVAARVAGDRVGLYLADGRIGARVDGSTYSQTGITTLPGGGTLQLDPSGLLAVVRWPDGSQVSVSSGGTYLSLRVSMAAARAGQLTGLLGDADGDPSNDHRTRAGAVVPLDTPVPQLLETFVDTWRVGSADTLFDYADGQSTDAFTDPDFPRQPGGLASLPGDAVSAAFQACVNAGVTGQEALDACALDVATTGDVQAASGALVAQYGQPTGPSIVADGGFEDPPVNGSFASYNAPATVGPWRVTSGGIDLMQGYATPAEGRQSVDLNGCSAGRLEQDLTWQPGTTYVVTLQHSGSSVPFHVEAAGETVLSVPTSGGRWQRVSTTFTPSTTTGALAIQSDGGGCWGPYVDDVAVYPVP